MKLLGVALLLAAALLWGLEQNRCLQRRAADLRELCRALSLLSGEIRWRQADFSAIAAAHPELPFFCRWAQLRELSPEEACMAAAGPMGLSETDRKLLREFAACAGKTDRAGQLQQLETTRRRLEEEAMLARQETKEKGRVQLAAALCIGGTLGLFLL